MKTAVRETSINAYHQLNLTPQHNEILAAFRVLEASCIADVSAYLNWQKSTVAARINELKHDGILVFAGKKKSETTGITCEFWREKTPETLFAI